MIYLNSLPDKWRISRSSSVGSQDGIRMKLTEDEKVKDCKVRERLTLLDTGVTQHGSMALGEEGHNTIAKTKSR